MEIRGYIILVFSLLLAFLVFAHWFMGMDYDLRVKAFFRDILINPYIVTYARLTFMADIEEYAEIKHELDETDQVWVHHEEIIYGYSKSDVKGKFYHRHKSTDKIQSVIKIKGV